MHWRKSLQVLVIVLVGPAALAQQAVAPRQPGGAKALTFEVVTIKPNARTDGGWRLEATPDGYTGMGVSLLKLVGEAYGISDTKFILGGLSWMDRDKFDIEAKFDAAEIPMRSLTYRQRADMLQPALADRFHLKVHRETKEFPVYNLVVAKTGTKLQETKPEDVTQGVGGPSCLFRRGYDGYIQVQGCRPEDLELHLSYLTGRTVIDKTGITKRYNFELRWTPTNAAADASEASGPSIFTALQEQLGLKLEPATAALSILVIDSADRPSEN